LEKKETENENEVRSERETTPDQSPSTKAKLRKVCLSINFVYFKINNFSTTGNKLKKVFFNFYDTYNYV